MPRYFVDVTVLLSSGARGPGFNAQVEGESYADALEKMKAQVTQALKDSNLAELTPVVPSSSESKP